MIVRYMMLPWLLFTQLAVTRAQEPDDPDRSQPVQKFWFQPYAGPSWQSTLFKPVFDFTYHRELGAPLWLPIMYERKTQGFGLDLGIVAGHPISSNHFVGLSLSARLRYDYFYGVSGWPENDKVVKAFIADVGARVVFGYRLKNNETLTTEFGFTINETGKYHRFDMKSVYGTYALKLKFQYTSLNVTVGYDWKTLGRRLMLGNTLQYNYIPKGHPAYPWRDFSTLLIGGRVKWRR